MLTSIVRFFSEADTIETFRWNTLLYPEVLRLRAHYQEKNYSPNSGNRALSAVRQVAAIARRLGQISGNDFALINEVKGIRGKREPRGRALALPEIRRLFEAAAQTSSIWRATRDAAMLALLFGAGLRRQELVSIRLENLTEDSDGQFVLVVVGKGNKERTVPLPDSMRPTLEAWLLRRGKGPGFLFPHREHMEKRFCTDSVYKWLRQLARRAELQPLSPHFGRYTYISELLDNGADVVVVARLAGHAQLETTRRYDRRGVRSMKRAVNLLSFQFSR